MFVGKVHGSLARAGKVKGQTPKVDKQEKKKKRTGTIFAFELFPLLSIFVLLIVELFAFARVIPHCTVSPFIIRTYERPMQASSPVQQAFRERCSWTRRQAQGTQQQRRQGRHLNTF